MTRAVPATRRLVPSSETTSETWSPALSSTSLWTQNRPRSFGASSRRNTPSLEQETRTSMRGNGASEATSGIVLPVRAVFVATFLFLELCAHAPETRPVTGFMLDVLPDDAELTVDGQTLGPVAQLAL